MELRCAMVMLLLTVVGVVMAAPTTDFETEVMGNLSAVWEELAYVKAEIANHHHEGHEDETHDTLKMDVDVMKHEHHIHHHHTEEETAVVHPYHHLHHSHHALQHLDSDHTYESSGSHVQDEHDTHGLHGDSHSHDGNQDEHYHDKAHEHGDHEHHSHGHEHGDHEHHSHGHEHGDHEHHSHGHEHGDHEHHSHGHEHHGHGHEHGDHEHHGHGHEHGDHEHHGHSHEHGDHDHDDEGEQENHDHDDDNNDHEHHSHDHDHEHHGHDHDHHGHDHDHHGHDHEHHDHEHHDHDHRDHEHHGHDQAVVTVAVVDEIHDDHVVPFNISDHDHHDSHHHQVITRDDLHHPSNQDGDLAEAICEILPTTQEREDPVPEVRGNITFYRRKDAKGPMYLDVQLTGFAGAGLHAIHIHSTAATGGDCSTSGSHFNPHGVDHGGPSDNVRHTGDLGNLQVGESGEVSDYLIVDHMLAFTGQDSVITRSLVIHEGEDDLGLGGHPTSKTSGNAGFRIACCNIFMKAVPVFRFGG